MPAKTSSAVALEDLPGLVGTCLGVSRWHTVTQEQINLFAQATGDDQWLHVDPERARSGPFGTTIAHGYLTLSLGPMLLWDAVEVTGVSRVLNYGIDRVRFPSPVPVNSRVRLSVALLGVSAIDGGLSTKLGCTFELEGAPKPACVAEIVFCHFR